MTEKIQELLAVLNWSEEQQWTHLYNYEPRILKAVDFEKGCKDVNHRLRVLAGLSFRLRDEVVYLRKLEKRDSGDYDIEHCLYRNAMEKVYDCVNHTTVFYSQNPPQKYFIWWIETAKPIHWIIAALIAKELSKET